MYHFILTNLTKNVNGPRSRKERDEEEKGRKVRGEGLVFDLTTENIILGLIH